MKSFAQVLDLKDDPALIQEYKELHQNVWPEVLHALSQIGITKMKIFLLGVHLFMYFEAGDGFDPQRDFQRYTTLTPKANEWDEFMRKYQQKVAEAAEQDWWAPMEEVFDLESQLAAAAASKKGDS
ncbi:L-rhamnose mutarotase [Balamuthia mandrillaris]